MSKNRKILVILIPFVLLLCCCFSCIIFYIIGIHLPPEIKLASSQSNSWASDSPTTIIKFQCTNTQTLSINDKSLSRDEINSLCGFNGYRLDLKDGENVFNFKTANPDRKEATLKLNISFDLTAYNTKQSQQAEQQKQAELEKEKQDADAKAKADAEAKKSKEGDVISGIGISQIWSEYNKQKELSEVKANMYLDSLADQSVVWVGTVSDVDNKLIGGGYFVHVHMSGGVFDSQDFSVDDPSQSFTYLNKGQLIKVTAKIKSVDNIVGGLSVFLKDAQIEVIN